ncbi:MAG: DUF1638 domain-containing protein [Chloroflexota bacterium]
MKTALITCGALVREVSAIIQIYTWDAHILGIPANDHLRPERIAPHVEKRILDAQNQYERIIVVYGDCGTRGALDEVLSRYAVKRLSGPHCYEMYAGAAFQEIMAEEPGTFFLTDFLARAFHGSVIKGLGLDRYPQLREEQFRNYQRVIYLEQKHDPELIAQAERISRYLNLPLEIRNTGYGLLEERLKLLMEEQALSGD